jgi:hypothetical protein
MYVDIVVPSLYSSAVRRNWLLILFLLPAESLRDCGKVPSS